MKRLRGCTVVQVFRARSYFSHREKERHKGWMKQKHKTHLRPYLTEKVLTQGLGERISKGVSVTMGRV